VGSVSFEKLDDKMQSWGRKTFGDKYAKDLWRNELLEISTLKPNEDELHKFAFEMHCTEVYDMLCEDNVRKAEGLFYSDRFWTVTWQVECRQRQREKLFCHLETLVSEEAYRQVQWLPWRGTAYAVPQHRGSTRIIFFAPSDEKTVIG
jgi:hypothetical protein